MDAKDKKKAYDKHYETTERGKRAIERYRSSDKGLTAIHRYQRSSKGQVATQRQRDADKDLLSKAMNKSERYSQQDIDLILTKKLDGVTLTDAEIGLRLGRTRDGIVSSRRYYLTGR